MSASHATPATSLRHSQTRRDYYPNSTDAPTSDSPSELPNCLPSYRSRGRASSEDSAAHTAQLTLLSCTSPGLGARSRTARALGWNCLRERLSPGGAPGLLLQTVVGSAVSSPNPAPGADNPRGPAVNAGFLSPRRSGKPWPAAAVCLQRRKSRSASARRSNDSFAATRRTHAVSSSCCCWVSGGVYPPGSSDVRIRAPSRPAEQALWRAVLSSLPSAAHRCHHLRA